MEAPASVEGAEEGEEVRVGRGREELRCRWRGSWRRGARVGRRLQVVRRIALLAERARDMNEIGRAHV